jgi:hypothetical protein
MCLMLADGMTPQDWISVSAVVATVAIAGLGLWFSFVTQRRQQGRDDKKQYEQQRREDQLRREQQGREDQLRTEHRESVPRIELGINSQILGQDDDHYLVEFTLTAYNRGLVRWQVRDIKLRVRGIEKNRQFAYWPGRGQRVEFPVKIINKEKVIPESLNFLFVEPGIQQTITYVTKVPDHIIYMVVYGEFWYDEVTPHTSERVFRLTAPFEST